jgi:hypothetical protein
MNQTTDTTTPALLRGDAGYDPIEDRLRQNIRATIEALFEEELAAFIGRCRYDRGRGLKKGYRHGHRERQLVGTFGTETISVPRARIENEEGRITEWRSSALPRYQRLTRKAEALVQAMVAKGMSEFMTRLFVSFDQAIAAGYLAVPSDDLKTLTGQAGQSVRDFLMVNRAALASPRQH